MSIPLHGQLFAGTPTITGRDATARTAIVGVSGVCVMLNGVDANAKFDGVSATPLILDPPVDELMPATTTGPTVGGKIFGSNLKWRFRYHDPDTNDYSGMSPIPSRPLSLGALTQPGLLTWMGERAFFMLPGKNSGKKIQLLRNSTDQDRIWYVVATVADPGSGSYARVEDNTEEDELILSAEDHTEHINPGPSEGGMWPVLKAFPHPTGRLMYYGKISRPRSEELGGVDYTADPGGATQHATLNSGTTFPIRFTPDMVGLSIKPLAQASFATIVQVVSETEIVWSPSYSTGGTNEQFSIEDRRDPRTVFVAEPGQPNSIDMAKVLFVGSDFSDDLHHITGLDGATFALTKRHLIRWENDASEDPSLSTSFSVVAKEGCVGPWAAADTPYGVVYLSGRKGVRIFSGQFPQTLGGASPADKSPIQTFVNDANPNLLYYAHMSYDPDLEEVRLSLADSGSQSMDMQMVFSFKTGAWRGPWRVRCFASGVLRGPDGDDGTYYGDECGSVFLSSDAYTLDGTDPDTSLTGTVGTAIRDKSFTVVSAKFFPCAAPIYFYNSSGVYQTRSWTAPTLGSTTELRLITLPDVTVQSGWTFRVGDVQWSLTTGYLDGGEPINPKKLARLRLRVQRSSADDTFLLESASDAGTFTSVPVFSPDDKVHIDGVLPIAAMGGHAFIVRLSGLSDEGAPKITKVIADIDIRGGAKQ